MQIYDRKDERTGVQEIRPYDGKFNVQCDFVMVYGIHNIKERVKPWKKKGYVIHLMTGVSWGEYQDYLYGKFDGRDHHSEGQVRRDGNEINHGKDVPYMVPAISFAEYLTEKLKVAVDAGVEAIHLEEPEFWVSAGYSEAFKREWQIYYKEPWQDPASSCEAQYRCSKLKQYLYTRMLDRLCSALKEYAMVKYGRLLRFYVPTHSLINYSQWRIVSPESALIDLPGVDGYIAQIWTGTSRTANQYEGVVKERTFETAFLEYGIMQELVRGTGRRMWYLADPIEDDPKHTWADYRYNYYRTVTASLLHPEIYNFEVAPWPSRVFMGQYPREDGNGKEVMPWDYRTNLLSVMNTLRDMKQDDVSWREEKSEIGILLADSAMFERIYPDGDPKQEAASGILFSPLYGLALPLLKHGLATRPVQLDNIRRFAGYLKAYRAMVLSYEFMKPEFPDIHNAIAGWIREGGVLVYVGDGADSFHKIRAWWNTGDCNYNTPAEHLFEACGLSASLDNGIYEVGKGLLCVINSDPASFAENSENANVYRSYVKETLQRAGIEWKPTSAMILDRGPYTITAVLDESEYSKPYVLEGSYVDLYSSSLNTLENPTLEVGSVGLYYNLAKTDKKAPVTVIAAAARLEKYKATARSCSFVAYSANETECAIRLALKRPPLTVSAELTGKDHPIDSVWDESTKTLLLKFANSDEGVSVKLKFVK
ncbi:MAG: hypothetical protein IJA85_09120 [Clostridia bacterium]|nr:hypothetical protein [Clostridia bacterium]